MFAVTSVVVVVVVVLVVRCMLQCRLRCIPDKTSTAGETFIFLAKRGGASGTKTLFGK